jgi:hypothetical protein
MQFNWSKLGRTRPKELVVARLLAHHTLQWAARTARANLEAAPDDSHTSLEWDAGLGALLSRPLPVKDGPMRIGLDIARLQLMFVGRDADSESFPLEGATDAEAGIWVDWKLQALGLKPAGTVTLPYAMPAHPLPNAERYDLGMLGRELGELSRWFSGAAEMLGVFKSGLGDLRPGPGPVRCWPHHFDIATLVRLDENTGESARSVGVGLSPGDEFYAQPYAYVSPWPRFDGAELPPLPPPGHWHTQGFFGAVATGEEILALAERGPGLLAFVTGAFETSRVRLQDR